MSENDCALCSDFMWFPTPFPPYHKSEAILWLRQGIYPPDCVQSRRYRVIWYRVKIVNLLRLPGLGVKKIPRPSHCHSCEKKEAFAWFTHFPDVSTLILPPERRCTMQTLKQY